MRQRARRYAKRRDKLAVAQKGSENCAAETLENQVVQSPKPGARKEKRAEDEKDVLREVIAHLDE